MTPNSSAAPAFPPPARAEIPSKALCWLALSSGSFSRSTSTSGRRKTASSSSTTKPWLTSARRLCLDAPVNSISSLTGTRPVEQSVRRSSACCGALPRFLAAASAASSAGTARAAMDTYFSFTRRLPPLNQNPAGNIAFTASYTVQKKRSRIHMARLSRFRSSRGSSSRTDETGLSFSKELSPASARTMPSVGRLERVNGTSTLTPGTTRPARDSGMT